MKELTSKVQRVKGDLRTIQEQLELLNSPGTSTSERVQALDELLSVELLEEFKAAIDEMRSFLWSYLEAHAWQSEENAVSLAESLRKQRAAEALRILHNGPDKHAKDDSVFQSIQDIAEATIKRHSEDPTDGSRPRKIRRVN